MQRQALSTTLAASLGLIGGVGGLTGTAAAHDGTIMVYRNAAGELYMNYPWSTPTHLDEVLAPYRGDSFQIFITRRVIPSIPLDQYPPYEGSQIYIEVVDAVGPSMYMRDGANPSRIIAGPQERFFAGQGGLVWDKFVWMNADQFHPTWPWTAFEWYLDIRAVDLTGMHTDSPVYRFKVAIEHFCAADVTDTAIPGGPGYREPNNIVNNDDFFVYLTLFAEGHWRADQTATAVPGAPGFGDPDGLVTNDDFFYYLTQFVEGCHL